MLHTILTVVAVAAALAVVVGFGDAISLARTTFRNGTSDAVFLVAVLVVEHAISAHFLGMGFATTVLAVQVVLLLRPWSLLTQQTAPDEHTPVTRDAASEPTPAPVAAQVAREPLAARGGSHPPVMGFGPNASRNISADEDEAFTQLARQFDNH